MSAARARRRLSRPGSVADVRGPRAPPAVTAGERRQTPLSAATATATTPPGSGPDAASSRALVRWPPRAGKGVGPSTRRRSARRGRARRCPLQQSGRYATPGTCGTRLRGPWGRTQSRTVGSGGADGGRRARPPELLPGAAVRIRPTRFSPLAVCTRSLSPAPPLPPPTAAAGPASTGKGRR